MAGRQYFPGEKAVFLIGWSVNFLTILLKGQSLKNSDGPNGPDNRPFSFGGVNGKRTA